MLRKKSKEKLRKLCIKRNKSQAQREAVSKFNKGKVVSIKTRKKISKSKKGKWCGKDNANWRGGTSFEPYSIEFNDKLRNYIRKLYHYRCQECFRHQEELRRKLDVHHIDHNKQNNNPNNLLPLCRSCHAQIGFKKDNWMAYFQEKVIR